MKVIGTSRISKLKKQCMTFNKIKCDSEEKLVGCHQNTQ